MKKIFFVTVIAFAVGFGSARFFVPSSSQVKFEELKSKAQSLTDDAQLALGSVTSDRCDKAERALEKVLLVFLYDLGVRIQNKELNERLVALKQNPNELSAARDPVLQKPSVEEETKEVPTKIPQNLDEPSMGAENASANAAGQDSNSFGSESERKTGGRLIRYPNAGEAWGTAKGISPQIAQWINGQYLGVATFADAQVRKKQRGNWAVEIFVSGQIEENIFNGKMDVYLTDRNGKIFSRTEGNGNQDRHIRVASDGAILVAAGGGDVVFQLKPFPKTGNVEGFMGNVYVKDEQWKWSPVGGIRLSKK